MTLQSLLSSHKDKGEVKVSKEIQLQKTAELLAKNKLAAQNILLGALNHLKESESTSKEVVKKIWI